jgi:hypothetical protein
VRAVFAIATRAGIVRHVDSLMAYLGRSFEHAAKVVCRKTAKKTKPGLINAKGAPFLSALNRTGINEFACQVEVFGFREHERSDTYSSVRRPQPARRRSACCVHKNVNARNSAA